jgi:anti-sigma regulatory factor (Ser/Thr protein kinase)
MDDPSWSYEIKLAAEPVSAPRARAFVCRHLIEHGVAYLADPVRLVVSELATNAMIHARSSFTVSLSCAEGTVRLAVRDEPPAGRVPPQVQRTDLSGRGLRMVELISSDWGVASDGPDSQTVWASFDLRHRELARGHR